MLSWVLLVFVGFGRGSHLPMGMLSDLCRSLDSLFLFGFLLFVSVLGFLNLVFVCFF